MLDDTICAPSTPPVNSPIAVIRMSGPDTLRAVTSIFNHADKITPRCTVYGSILENGKMLDDVIVVFFKSPESFTGEDAAEIHCHGNPIIVHKIIKLLNRQGVRIAEPGEFCKIDLTEAEAINQIIRARSDWEIDAAIKQMHGSFRNAVHAIRERLILLKADFECSIDFIEEDIEFISGEQALQQLKEIRALLEDVFRRCKIGEKMTHGIDVPIVGKPNVGKSSILNLILNSERAIVSNIPGTTRDLIKEIVQFAGMQVNLIDTAGIDSTESEIEKKGIELSQKKIDDASIIIMVLDAMSNIHEADRRILERIKNKITIFLVNKIDLVSGDEVDRITSQLEQQVIPFSAVTGEGLQELERVMSNIIRNEFIEYKNSFISDIRVLSILENSFTSIDGITKLIVNEEPPEIISFEIHSLIENLSEITGEITPDDVLNSIFGRFCIGK
jgi:tRNA modification GTPase